MSRATTLHSKNIVITGATSGIGLEIVRQLYENNRISAICRPSSRLDDLKEKFPAISIYEADLSDREAVRCVGELIADKGDPIDILINNAAVQFPQHFTHQDFHMATIAQEIDTNLAAPAILIYTSLPALSKSREPIILNINSGLGLTPKTSSAMYCASKGGLNLLSQSLASQFEEIGVRVVQAFLPLVDTKMTKGRGTSKVSASDAATKIIGGIASNKTTIDIGKVKILRILMRLAPSLALKIMRKA